jgi:hypothetical protein
MANAVYGDDSKLDVMMSNFACLKDATADSLANAIVEWNEAHTFDMSF